MHQLTCTRHAQAHLRSIRIHSSNQLPCKAYLQSAIRCRSTRKLSQLPSDWRPGTPTSDVEQLQNLHEQNYARPTLITLDYFRRALKFTLIGFVILASTTCTAFEAVHAWVENVELAPDRDEENAKWGWTQEAERWSGGERGGTDPALGYKARHAIRSAWIAQNWGTGSSITRSTAIEGAQPGASAVSAGLEFAHDFLNVALSIALTKQQEESKSLRPQTLPELLSRHANVLERMGTRGSLFDARSDYERVWAMSDGRAMRATRTAAKLGDLCSRLGDSPEALEWWSRALLLVDTGANAPKTERVSPTTMSSADTHRVVILLPESIPTSPLTQRTLASIISSLSAHYAQSGDLLQAKAMEETGLQLFSNFNTLPSSSTNSSSSSRSPARTLHELFLLHRTCLLSMHLAEVNFALKEDSANSLVRLRKAANASEQIANILTGSPLTHPDAPSSSIPPPPSPEKSLLSSFKKSSSLRKPASGLLRDARRSAVEAWTLAGILSEGDSKRKDSLTTALECYERALAWAGASADSSNGMGQPGEGTLEKDWTALWQNYVRVRDAVRLNKTK